MIIANVNVSNLLCPRPIVLPDNLLDLGSHANVSENI